MDAERNLLYLYLGCIVSGATTASSLGIAWAYWTRTLNTCVDVNCGCILYSTSTFNSFVGGAVLLCRFSTLVQIPVLLWAITMLLFHAYRVCIPKTNKPVPTRRTVVFNEDGKRRPDTRPTRSPPMYIPLAIVAGLIAVLLVGEVWVITGGYYSTCREYRKTVAKQLSANGNLAELVFERMSCGTVLDFLDYLQPDPPMLEQQYRRTYIINTSYFLQFGVVFSWVSCLMWAMTALYNAYLSFHK